MRFSVIASAVVAAVVGFGGTLALIIAAAQALGATQAETASWVTACCLAMFLATGYLSWRYKMPIISRMVNAWIGSHRRLDRLYHATGGGSVHCHCDSDHSHRVDQTGFCLCLQDPGIDSVGHAGRCAVCIPDRRCTNHTHRPVFCTASYCALLHHPPVQPGHGGAGRPFRRGDLCFCQRPR